MTYPVLRAIGPLHPALTVLHIDAHADLYTGLRPWRLAPRAGRSPRTGRHQHPGRSEWPLVGADIVQYNPTQDVAGLTAHVAAKFVKELAGLMLTGPAASLAGLP